MLGLKLCQESFFALEFERCTINKSNIVDGEVLDIDESEQASTWSSLALGKIKGEKHYPYTPAPCMWYK